MQAGLLNEPIIIEEPLEGCNEYGGTAREWHTFVKTKAQVTYSSGNRVNENNEIFFTYEVVFTIRYYHKVQERMRIIWKNKKYRILSIEEDKHLQLLRIKAELINE